MKTKTTCNSLLIVFSLVIMSINSYSQAPSWQWAKHAGGAGGDYAGSVATDIFGNIYMGGYFASPIIVFGTTTLINTSSTGNYPQMYLTKYDPSGNVIWAKTSTGGNNLARSISTDILGNIYLLGGFSDSTIIIGSDTLINSGSGDVFLAKYDGSGNPLWAKSIKGNNSDYASSLTIDTSGIYIAGNFNSDSITLESTTLINADADSSDIFFAKYNSSGDLLWAKGVGGVDYDNVSSLATDGSGNLYLTGSFNSNSITFDTYTLTNTGGLDQFFYPASDIFIAKYDNFGNVRWAKNIGGNDSDGASAIAIESANSIYVAGGFYSSTINFSSSTILNMGGANSCDVFITKIDSLGNINWAKSGGTTTGSAYATCLSVNNSNVYLAGNFWSPNLSLGSFTLANASTGTTDVFLAKYDTTGNTTWATRAGQGNFDVLNSITTDVTGNVYVTGGFESPTISFGSTTLSNVNFAPGSGLTDIYLAKVNGIVGINESPSNQQINVYPNPSSGQFNFNGLEKGSQIEVFDMTGKIIYQSIASNDFETINISDKAKGIYFYRITKEMRLVQNGKVSLQ